MTRLFDNALNSDFTVYCQDKQYKVHKAIICLQGGFFAKVTTAQFKEKDEHVGTKAPTSSLQQDLLTTPIDGCRRL